jgi:hypothetical protein
MLEEDVVTLTAEQLNWLLDGYDVWWGYLPKRAKSNAFLWISHFVPPAIF